MQTPRLQGSTLALPFVRWGARLLSAAILLFWGCFIVAHLVGDAGQSSRPLNANDYAQITMMLLWLVGLAVAWRWELAGAVAALTGGLIGALLNPNAAALIVAPGVPAVMFLFCWWWSRASRREIGSV